MQPSIFSQSPEELNTYLDALKVPKFRKTQLREWLFQKPVSQPSDLSNMPASLRQKLAEDFSWELPRVVQTVTGKDGATKMLLAGAKGQVFEAVILRYPGRVSLCISSQVGCKLACSFCQTGKLGFFRNLSAAEIVGQFVLAKNLVAAEGRRVSHIVFMGMGEPLDNFESVAKACELFTGKEAYGLSPRRVTVSTSGIVPKITELSVRAKVSLAVSLHAATGELRTELMPINRKYPLAQLKEALLDYQKDTGDLITIEYILIRGKNCGPAQAKALVKYLHGLRAKVNLIPFNAHPGSDYGRPEEEEIKAFQSYLSRRGFPAPVRYSLGLDVSGGCGQLAAKNAAKLHAPPERRAVIGG